jgi:hypothetical protein
MRKTSLTAALFLIFALIFSDVGLSQTSAKFQKWQAPSFFRGYNILHESPHTLQDFIDFKNYGGNLFHIGTFGWNAEDPPYGIKQQNIDGTDLLVNFCRQAGIYYTIAVRSGPGAYDTYLESEGITGESRIWEKDNITEQTLYAQMLGNIVQRYSADSLFVGLVLVVEPRPKVRFIPANKSETYKLFLETVFNIQMDEVYQGFINHIRTIDPEIPLIAENFAYSTAELFPSYELNDPFIIYSAHNYQPGEYTKADAVYSATYPGTFWNLTFLAQKFYDKEFIRSTIFGRVKEFEEQTGKPVFLGEFGMFSPQHGAYNFIGDVLDICIENGWHFALWDWRRSSGLEWNIENFHLDTTFPAQTIPPWVSVLMRFYPPPVPVQLFPVNGIGNVQQPVLFSWQPMTSFTFFDIEIYDGSILIGSGYDLSADEFNFDGNLKWSREYQWKLRAKNPGTISNVSDWTSPESFVMADDTTGSFIAGSKNSKQNKLNQNYPNPFNPSTSILYSVKSNSDVKLVIYDLTGREVKTLINSPHQEGSYSVVFDASNLPSGVYIYKLDVTGDTEKYSEVKRMVLIK